MNTIVITYNGQKIEETIPAKNSFNALTIVGTYDLQHQGQLIKMTTGKVAGVTVHAPENIIDDIMHDIERVLHKYLDN